MKKQFLYYSLLVVITFISFSCKDKKDDKKAIDTSKTWPSIKEYVMDQWSTYAGTPIVMTKIVKLNGKTDSSFTSADTLAWASIIKLFFDADISDKKYIGKYEFTLSENTINNTHNLYYQALDDDLYTQKFLIVLDNDTRKIVGIYIEIHKSTFWNDEIQQLYYAPMKTIQIQIHDVPKLGSKKDMVIQYNFMI